MTQPQTDRRRQAGILLHPTSLPGRFGIGDLGPQADRFLDWAASAGQTIWQVLPLGPTGHGNTPYGSVSAFAGNPLLISPQLLCSEGLLPQSALERAPAFPAERVDFPSVASWKERILRESWDQFRRDANGAQREALGAFVAAPEQAYWLGDWARFAALKRHFGGRPWTSWPREPGPADLAEAIAFETYLQFLFFRQWDRVKCAAKSRGITVMGDIPIYLSHDSADVWSHRELFDLDARGFPTAVSGVPPDYFSETGQLWGNPLYRWDRLEAQGFSWWVARIRANLRTCDLLRIDHFRGFAAYWSVPPSETTALNGRWIPGPGRKLFDAMRSALGDLPFVAEDLGDIKDDVRRLLKDLGIPGMKVLQFAFAAPDSEHLPHRHVPNAVVYTGTHDNDTTRGWYEAAKPEERERLRDYLGSEGADASWDLIRAAYTSVAERAIVPMQDVLGLGSEARLNTPSEPSGNWSWRAAPDGFRPEDALRLKRLAALTGASLVKAADPEVAKRLPPGQVLTVKWPVLTYGETPRTDLAKWSFRCFGLVEREATWNWEEFSKLPRVEVVSDIHCVTHWSRLDNRWEGVAVREILKRVGIKPGAVAVLVHADGGYTTNVAVEDLIGDDVLLATRHDGRELEAEHGGPCRLVVPRLYLWKSAKWVRAFEFLDVNPPGFWEENGYHMHADPWTEERYSDGETDAMQRMRSEAAKKLRERGKR